MKYILLVGDGMADIPVAELNDRTPIQVANTSNADRISCAGEIGTVQTVPYGIPPGTDTAFVGIMGFDVREVFTGRSPLEAAGMGIELLNKHTAFRCNLVSITPDVKFGDANMLSHSGTQLSAEEGHEMMTWLMEHPRFKERMNELNMVMHAGTSYRHIVTMGEEYFEDAMPKNLKVTPPHDILGEPIRENLPIGTMAYALMDITMLSNELLPMNPINIERKEKGIDQANCIWLWGQGYRPGFVEWKEKFGITGSVISAVPLVNGIGRLCGLKTIDVEGATGELDTNYDGKADAAITALKSGDDFVLVHLEAPDECTHNGDMEGKIEAISRLDKMLGRILNSLNELNEDYRLMVLSDHQTLLCTRGHAPDPVPFLIYDSRVDAEKQRTFDEECAEKADNFVESGDMLMPKLFEK